MNLTKFLNVYSKFLHTSLASELEYKANILIDLITAIFSLLGSIFLLSIFFQNTGNIGGFSMQVLWIFLLFPLFRVMWSAGTKKYTAMGS